MIPYVEVKSRLVGQDFCGRDISRECSFSFEHLRQNHPQTHREVGPFDRIASYASSGPDCIADETMKLVNNAGAFVSLSASATSLQAGGIGKFRFG